MAKFNTKGCGFTANYREILRLSSLGESIRFIARSTGSSRDTVTSVLNAAKKANISWPLDDEVSNKFLEETLFPDKRTHNSSYTQPDFPFIHKELARKGVTLTLLWEEYCERVRNDNGVPYMYTQFCEKYRRWARITKTTMRITHKPGDAMQVDWAGAPITITNSITGEHEPAYIFVAVLPCSWYTYAEACDNMKMENWLSCHVHAFNYFGGVPRLLIPDNCKTAVNSNTRYETILELAKHYGTAIVPTRVRKPDDKAAVEGSVRFVSTWITASLRNRKFFSVAEAQQAVSEKLDELNRRPFKNSSGCRLSAYEQEEKDFMRPLPRHAFEAAIWLYPKVGYDYLISDGMNKYSVPYDLIGEKVEVKLTKSIVEVFYNQSRVAIHVRLDKRQRDPVVKPEHMPEAHRKYLNYTADEFIEWGQAVGPNTAKVVQYFLNEGREAEQGFKLCASLTKLEKRYSSETVEDACARVLNISSHPTIRNISILCKASSKNNEEDSVNSDLQGNKTHGITRGAAYYSKRRNS